MFKLAIHLLLSAVMLLASSGLVVNKHFCLDRLVSAALYSKAKRCSLGKTIKDVSPIHPGNAISKKSCCDDDHKLFKIQHEQRSGTLTLHFTVDKEPFTPSTLLPYKGYKVNSDDALHRKKPPLPHLRRQAILQRFLC